MLDQDAPRLIEMNATEKLSGIIFQAVNDALPPDQYEVSAQTIMTSVRDQCIVTVVVRERST